MESSKDMFRKSFDKAASQVKLSPDIISDVEKFKGDMKEVKKQKIKGGKSDKLSLGDIAQKHKIDIEDLVKQFLKGLKVEMEHTQDKNVASEIAMDHLTEDPKYYSKLEKIETKEATGTGSSGAFEGPFMGGDTEFFKKSQEETPRLNKESIGDMEKVEATEATGSGSSGAYETPAAWAKSTKKKDWGGKKKTQYPGGKFVSIKKKCTKFPYCNQGDIKALKIYENDNVKSAIKQVSNTLKINETTIKAILQYEFEKNQIK